MSVQRDFASRTLFVVAILMAPLSAIPTGQASEFVGLVEEQPDQQPFVKTDKGYMVPYKLQVAGTELEFEMVPVPGESVIFVYLCDKCTRVLIFSLPSRSVT